MRIFLAGATGVAGRRVVPLLVAAGHQVTAVGRTPEKRVALEKAGATAAAVDLFDADALRPVVAGHQVVINLATHIPSSTRLMLPGAWDETARLRREASANLVDAAIAGGADRFIQESLALAYPDRGAEWIDEETPLQPGSYARTVLDAENAARRFTQSGRTGVALRFAGFYGPDSPQTREVIAWARRGRAVLPGAPDAFVSSIALDDVATAVIAALNVAAGVYNVVDDEPLRRREYSASLAAALGVPPLSPPGRLMTVVFGPAGETLARSQRVSNRKLREASDWVPHYPSLREGWPDVLKTIAA